MGKTQQRERERGVKSWEVRTTQDLCSPGLSFLFWKVEVIILPNAKGCCENSMNWCSKKCSVTGAKARQETSSVDASLITPD